MPLRCRAIAALYCSALFFAASPSFAQTTADPRLPSVAYADQIRSINPRVHAELSRAYASELLRDAHALHVDPRLVMAMVTVESHWNSGAVSSAGARGLGQLMPGTAHLLGVDARSARGNLLGMTTYLHRLLTMFASSRQAMRYAIASYNAGPVAVQRARGIPPIHETQRYVVKVLAALHSFKTRLSADPKPIQVAQVLNEAARIEQRDTAYWGVR